MKRVKKNTIVGFIDDWRFFRKVSIGTRRRDILVAHHNIYSLHHDREHGLK